MFDWLASWFGQWTGIVGQDITNLIHWSIRALQGWAGNIFNLVGTAWDDFYKANATLLGGLDHFAWRIWRHFEDIIKHDFPLIWHAWEWLKRWSVAFFKRTWQTIDRNFWSLVHLVERTRNDIVGWAQRDIYDPLKSYADRIWNDLVKWGYTAWYWVTHPDKFAVLLFWPIIGLLNANAWDAARVLGEFLTALFLHNLRKVAMLLEDILHAVL